MNQKTPINEILTKQPENRRKEKELFNELLKLSMLFIAPFSGQGRFTQWMNISDSNYKVPRESIEIYLSRIKGLKRNSEIPILFEGLKKGQTFETEILKVDSKFSVKEILEIAHNFYTKVAKNDGVNVGNEPFLLRLGRGSTAYATSLLILANDLGIKNIE